MTISEAAETAINLARKIIAIDVRMDAIGYICPSVDMERQEYRADLETALNRSNPTLPSTTPQRIARFLGRVADGTIPREF